MFAYFGARVKGSNKKYRNLFYDSGLEAVLAKAGHGSLVAVNRAAFPAGGLRGPVAVLEQKKRLDLRNVVAKSREPCQGRCGYATKEPFAVSRLFAVLQ